MDASLKKPLVLTIGLIVVLVIILLVSGSNATLNIFSIVIILALIAFVWFKFLQERNREPVEPVIPVKEPAVVPEKVEKEAVVVEEDDDDIRTRTGSPCEKAGLYVCKDHPDRTVQMKEGNRFPPCRGDKKGHSTTWILQ